MKSMKSISVVCGGSSHLNPTSSHLEVSLFSASAVFTVHREMFPIIVNEERTGINANELLRGKTWSRGAFAILSLFF